MLSVPGKKGMHSRLVAYSDPHHAIALQGIWVWGIVIAQGAFSDGVEGICHAGATWIMTQAIFAISSFVLIQFLQSLSTRKPKCLSARKETRNI